MTGRSRKLVFCAIVGLVVTILPLLLVREIIWGLGGLEVHFSSGRFVWIVPCRRAIVFCLFQEVQSGTAASAGFRRGFSARRVQWCEISNAFHNADVQRCTRWFVPLYYRWRFNPSVGLLGQRERGSPPVPECASDIPPVALDLRRLAIPWIVIGASLLVVPALCVLRLRWVTARRRHLGRCIGCGYDLKGAVSVRCPECGRSQVIP